MSDVSERLAIIKNNYADANDNEAADLASAKTPAQVTAVQANVAQARCAYYSAVEAMLSKSGADVENAYQNAVDAQNAAADARKKAAVISDLLGKLVNATDKATTLLNKAHTLEEGRAILADMRNDEIKPDVVTYTTLINKASTLDEGRAILADMRNDEIKPDVITYSMLLNKAHTLEEGRAILADMRNDGIKPEMSNYIRLLDKAHTLEEGRAILADMRSDEIKPNVVTYTALLQQGAHAGGRSRHPHRHAQR